METKILWPVQAQLGEGIIWHKKLERIFFVDIHGKKLHSCNRDGEGRQSWDMPEKIGWVIETDDQNCLLAGFRSGIGKIRLAPELTIEMICPFLEDQPHLRLNDAKMDSQGRIWGGVLNDQDESKADGFFYCFQNGEIEIIEEGYLVPNGPAISPDEKMMLHTDSARRLIYAFDFDVATGVLSNKRIWKEFTEADGYPDGMNFDEDGNIWIAHWGAARLSKWDCNNESEQIDLPVLNPTNLIINNKTLYIISAFVENDLNHAEGSLVACTYE